MELEVKGIKCDNQGCQFKDDNVQRIDYKEWLNKPCPNCGDNLLTEKDYNSLLIMEKICNSAILKFIDRMFGFICFWQKPVNYNINMNGTGTIDIKKDKNE